MGRRGAELVVVALRLLLLRVVADGRRAAAGGRPDDDRLLGFLAHTPTPVKDTIWKRQIASMASVDPVTGRMVD